MAIPFCETPIVELKPRLYSTPVFVPALGTGKQRRASHRNLAGRYKAGRCAPMRSDKVLCDMRGDAEKGKGEGKRQRGMQEATEIFVDFGECHGIIPFVDPPVSASG
jgi:hypothetical protein